MNCTSIVQCSCCSRPAIRSSSSAAADATSYNIVFQLTINNNAATQYKRTAKVTRAKWHKNCQLRCCKDKGRCATRLRMGAGQHNCNCCC